MTAVTTAPPPTLRHARPGDLAAILAIEQKSYPRPWSAQLWRDELVHPERVHLVAERDGEVVGYAGALVAASEAQVTTVATDPEHRRGGVATRLLLRLLVEAHAAGALSATLEVRESDTGAQALYERVGFVSAGVRPGYYQDNAEGAVILWLHGLGTRELAERLADVARTVGADTPRWSVGR